MSEEGTTKQSEERRRVERAASKDDKQHIAELEQKLRSATEDAAYAENELQDREAYLETMIEAFMIQYCANGEGVAEWAVTEAFAARGLAQ